jgi:hypothetical protein
MDSALFNNSILFTDTASLRQDMSPRLEEFDGYRPFILSQGAVNL